MPPHRSRSRLLPPALGAALLLGLATLPGTALAREWNDITPGESGSAEILAKFGEPSKRVDEKPRKLIAYYGDRSIAGAVQVQFHLDSERDVVRRIDVFPRERISRNTIESTYGPQCPRGMVSTDACYVEKVTDDGRVYLLYATPGVAVFLRPGGQQAQALSFLPDPSRLRKPTEGAGSSEDVISSSTDARDAIFAQSEEPEDGASQPGPGLDEAGRVFDPITIGGELFLSTTAERRQGEVRPFSRYGAPMIMDGFLDGRPNDRIRGFALGRLFYDPALRLQTGVGSPVGSAPVIALDQLWLRFDLAQRVFITAGKQHVKWGAARFWNPTDFLSLSYRDPLALFDSRLGADMVKLHLPWESAGWNFYAVGFLADRIGGEGKAVGAAGRMEAVLFGVELAATAVVREDRKPRYGLGFSSALWRFDVYGEASLRLESDVALWRLSDTPGADDYSARFERRTSPRQVYSASAGIALPLQFDQQHSVNLGVEAFYNSAGYTDAKLLPWMQLNGDFEPFYAAERYAAAYAQYSMAGIGEGLVLQGTVFANLSDHSYLSRLDVQVQMLNELSIVAFGMVPFGRVGGEFRFAADLPATPEQPAVRTPRTLFQLGLGARVKI